MALNGEQKGTHEEHLDVYNFKKKERKKEVQELEQEKEYLTAEKRRTDSTNCGIQSRYPDFKRRLRNRQSGRNKKQNKGQRTQKKK